MITIGSLFSGIGGFELGLERAIPNSKTVWQVEQNKYCRRVLRRHWPDAKLYNDVVGVGKDNLDSVDVICGGFPCQGFSNAGKKEGLNDGRSGLWWEMHRIISELQPRVAVLENVPALLIRGIEEVLGSLAEIGYDAEWCVIPAGGAGGFGAPHQRKRLFIVAYSSEVRRGQTRVRGSCAKNNVSRRTEEIQSRRLPQSSNTNKTFTPRVRKSLGVESQRPFTNNTLHRTGFGYWGTTEAPSPVCRVDDGIPNRLDKLRALGNAIVPQCSEWIGRRIVEAGLL